MPFVKLDQGILDSTLWVERECREMFITALLLAEPIELTEPMAQIEVRGMDNTGFVIPPGWYGMVHAAGIGIARRALVDDEVARVALEKLGSPDPESRSAQFEGRRLVRVDGGFIVLNFMKYRDRDYTAATRSARYRERKKALKQDTASHRSVTQSHRNITQAEAEAEAEAYKTNSSASTAHNSAASTPGNGETAPLPQNSKSNGKPTKAGVWATELRKLGVSITSMHPTLLQWIDDGFELPSVIEALQVARQRKPEPEKVPAAYIDPILRKPPKAPTVTWWASEQATIAKGREVGLEPRPGEEWDAFRNRIRTAAPN